MKTLITIIAVSLMSLTSSFANTDPLEDDAKELLREQVVALLENPNIKVDNASVSSTITFTINSNGELVVLDVVTKNTNVKQFVIKTLNYKKTALVPQNFGKVFKVKYTIEKA
jgi:hypothetical protein